MEHHYPNHFHSSGARMPDRAPRSASVAAAMTNPWMEHLWSAVALALAILALICTIGEFSGAARAGDSAPEPEPAAHSHDTGLSSI